METELEPKNQASLLTMLIIVLGIMGLFFTMISSFIISVIMGAILAIILKPFYKRLRARRLSSRWSGAILTLLLTLLILGPLLSFTITAVNQGVVIGEKLSKSENLTYEALSEKISAVPMSETLIGDQAAVEGKIRNGVKNGAAAVTAGILQFLSHLPDFLLHMILALIACYVFLIQGETLIKWTFAKIPLDQEVEQNIKISFASSASSVVLSVLAAAATQTVILLMGFLILGIPGAIFAAGATFIFALIPIVSSSPVWLSGALYLYLQGSVSKMFIMLGIGILTAVAENLVRPMVLKGSANMHPLLSLISIFGGLQMFGLFGVLIGPIIAALLVSLLEIWPVVARKSGVRFGGA